MATATATGSCLCGAIKVSVTGEPKLIALCHCLDCHKISGSHYSDNAMYLNENFNLVAGTPKTYVKTADSGNVITSHFCGDCGSTLWRSGNTFPGGVVLKTGVMDDPAWQAQHPAVTELFPQWRAGWLPELVKKA